MTVVVEEERQPRERKKKRPSGTMTKAQYRSALRSLGISVPGASRVFGLSVRQQQRYASGATAVPGPLAKLLRVMQKFEISPEQIRDL